MLKNAIRFIDHYFDDLAHKDNKLGRYKLVQTLFVLENACKSEYKQQREDLIALIQRDPTLVED